MLEEIGTVQRNDLLLRLKNFGLQTEIFKVADYKYLIYCKNVKAGFEELKYDFDNNIRTMCTNITLVLERPEKFQKKIKQISILNPVNNFSGSFLTLSDITIYLRSVFPNITIEGVSIPQQGLNFRMIIYVAKQTTNNDINEMLNKLKQTDLGTDDIIIKRNLINKKGPIPVIARAHTISDVMHLNDEFTISSSTVESNFWFENAEKIYRGDIKRNEIPFYRKGCSKCYLDASIFNSLNLRSLLLLYDTVYLALPLKSNMLDFLEYQNVTTTDLIELVSKGKLVLCLPNQESRYDTKLINDVYKENPNDGVISRRGLNVIFLTYLVELRTRFLKHYEKTCDFFENLDVINFKYNDENNILDIMFWPIIAAAMGFMVLNTEGPLKIPSFGINTLLNDTFAHSIDKQELFKNIQFELLLNSSNPHLSASLNATYFPIEIRQNINGIKYSDKNIAQCIGEFLQAFWYESQSLEKIRKINELNCNENNAINLITCKENISILKVADLADTYNTPNRLKRILMNLEKMESKDRKNTINDYNNLLCELSEAGNNNFIEKLYFGIFQKTAECINPAFGIFTSIIQTIYGNSQLKKNKTEMNRIEELMKNNNIHTVTTEDIFFLDKISRVVMIK